MKLYQTVLAAIVGIGSGIGAIVLLEPESVASEELLCANAAEIVLRSPEFSAPNQQLPKQVSQN